MTREAIPFPSLKDDPSSEGVGFLMLLGLDWGFDVWKSSAPPSLFFRGASTPETHSVVAVRKQELVSALDYDRSNTRYALVSFVDTKVREVVLARAILPLLDEYKRTVLEARDQLSKVKTPKTAVDTLNNLTKNVLYGVDVSAIVLEVPMIIRQEHWLQRTASDFYSIDRRFGVAQRSLAEQFQTIVEHQSEELERLESGLRAYSTQVGALLSATANLRLQVWMKWMTVTLLILAITTVVITLEGG